MNDKLIIGMPAGSLADAKRGGNLVTLLKAAGFRKATKTAVRPVSRFIPCCSAGMDAPRNSVPSSP